MRSAGARSIAVSLDSRHPLMQVWVVHHLQVIGEAVNCLSPGFIAARPDIPRRRTIGLRHALIRQYAGVALDATSSKAVHDLAPLEAVVAAILAGTGVTPRPGRMSRCVGDTVPVSCRGNLMVPAPAGIARPSARRGPPSLAMAETPLASPPDKSSRSRTVCRTSHGPSPGNGQA
ncbi:hypothetical protein DSECCO2_341890 [anaerobic digester metagenome]